MPIGETLAEARHQAGLTVSQVSERTRIRETIIRGIEHDDYSACGGDFYARGNIRSIAKAVGTDSEPLIAEYDTVHRAAGALSAVSLDELLTTSAQIPQPRRPDLPTVRGVVASGYASARGLAASGFASARRGVNLPAVRARAARAGPFAGRRPIWTAALALALVVVVSSGVSYLLAGARQAAVPSPAAGKPTAAHHHAGPGGPSPAPAASHAAVAPSAAPAPPAQPLAPVSAAAFGPGGGDNDQAARLAIDGRRATGWHTDWYTSARFGNLYPATGLLLDMGRAVSVTGARINLGRASGASFQLRVGTGPALAELHPVARAADAGGVVRLRLTAPAHGRYVLLWFTRLPVDPAGTFQAGVYNVSLAGRA